MKQRFLALDGLRGICAVIVLLFHDLAFSQPRPFARGYLSVDVFFVLSGFLITALLVGEYRRDGRMNIPAFYGRRVLRLIPALLFMLARFSAVTSTRSFSLAMPAALIRNASR